MSLASSEWLKLATIQRQRIDVNLLHQATKGPFRGKLTLRTAFKYICVAEPGPAPSAEPADTLS